MPTLPGRHDPGPLTQGRSFPDRRGNAHGSELIHEQTLFLAYLIMASQSHPDEVLQEWMKNAIFLKKALVDQSNLITHSILLVMYQQAQRTLPSLLNDWATAVKYEKQLLDILAPFGPQQMNVSATIKSDGLIAWPMIQKFSAHNQNKFYQFAQDEIALAQIPASHFADADAQFMNKYAHPKLPDNVTEAQLEKLDQKEMMKLLNQDNVTDLTIAGMAKGVDLFTAMSMTDARNRMLNLYVQMRVQGTTPNQVPAFLKTSPANFDPFTEQPFGYDANTKLIYFSVPAMADSKQGLFYN